MMRLTKTTLGSLCQESGGSIQTGPFGSQLHASDYQDAGIPVVMPQDIGDGGIAETRIARVSEEEVERLSRHKLRAGDIVYSRRGDVERSALVRSLNEGWLCGTGCLRVRTDDLQVIIPEFLAHYLRLPSVRYWITQNAIGATMPNLNSKILGRIPLAIPGVQIQRAIVEVLGALDDKIAANERVTNTLSKLNEALVRLAQQGGSYSMLGEVADLLYGKSLPSTKRVEGDVSVYGSGGKVGSHDVPLSEGPGVIVGRKGTIGSVFWSDGPFYPIDTTYFVRANASIPLEVLYFLIGQVDFSDMNSDSAVPGLSRRAAVIREILVPPAGRIPDLSRDLRANFKLSRGIDRQNVSLARTRDELLPLVMSGKITVKDAEAVVSDAV